LNACKTARLQDIKTNRQLDYNVYEDRKGNRTNYG